MVRELKGLGLEVDLIGAQVAPEEEERPKRQYDIPPDELIAEEVPQEESPAVVEPVSEEVEA